MLSGHLVIRSTKLGPCRQWINWVFFFNYQKRYTCSGFGLCLPFHTHAHCLWVYWRSYALSVNIITRSTSQQKQASNEMISKGLLDTIICPVIQKILALLNDSMTYRNPAVTWAAGSYHTVQFLGCYFVRSTMWSVSVIGRFIQKKKNQDIPGEFLSAFLSESRLIRLLFPCMT